MNERFEDETSTRASLPPPPINIFFWSIFTLFLPPCFTPLIWEGTGGRGWRTGGEGQRAEPGDGSVGGAERASERERERKRRGKKIDFREIQAWFVLHFFFLLLLRILDATPASILFHWGPGIWWFENFLFFHTHTHTYIYIYKYILEWRYIFYLMGKLILEGFI